MIVKTYTHKSLPGNLIKNGLFSGYDFHSLCLLLLSLLLLFLPALKSPSDENVIKLTSDENAIKPDNTEHYRLAAFFAHTALSRSDPLCNKIMLKD